MTVRVEILLVVRLNSYLSRRPLPTHRVSIVQSYAGLSPLHKPTTPYLSSTYPDLETGNEIDTIGKQ